MAAPSTARSWSPTAMEPSSDGGAERDDLADDERAVGFEGFALEAQAEAAGADGGQRGLADAGVGAVELADEQADVAAQLGAGAGAGDVGTPLVAERGPVGAVEGGVPEAVVEGGPGFVEDHHLFVVEVDVDGGGERERLGDAGVERDGADAAAGSSPELRREHGRRFEEEDLLGVGGEGDVGLAAGGGGELARGGGLAGEFVERVGVDVLLAGILGEEGERLAVGADDGVANGRA